MTPASRLRGGWAKGESQISTCMMFVPMHRFCTSVISQYDQTHLKMVSSSALFCSYSNNPALPSMTCRFCQEAHCMHEEKATQADSSIFEKRRTGYLEV